MPSINKFQPRPKPVHHNSSHLTDQVAQRFSLHRVKFATDLGKLPVIGYITIFCWASPKVASCGETVTMKRFRSSPAGLPQYDMPSFNYVFPLKHYHLGANPTFWHKAISGYSQNPEPPRIIELDLLSFLSEVGADHVRFQMAWTERGTNMSFGSKLCCIEFLSCYDFWFWRVEILNCCIGLKCMMNF